MKSNLTKIVLKALAGIVALSIISFSASANDNDDDSFAPGGTAVDHHTLQFQHLKIVMDLKARTPADLAFGATIAGRIMTHPDSHLVIIIEGPAISVFAKKNYLDHQGIVDTWADLAQKGVHVEYCGNSVHGAGLKPTSMTGLSATNPAVVNPGAFPTIANYEAQGYGLVIPMVLEQPKP